MQLGLRRDASGALETTRWLTLFYLPLLPVSRWQVRYAGMAFPSGPDEDESFVFEPVERLPLNFGGVLGTALCGWCLFAVALGPAAACVFGIRGAADNFQMVLVFASCGWPLAVIIWVRRRWRAFVEQPSDIRGDAERVAAPNRPRD
jgi:hypothetical protein